MDYQELLNSKRKHVNASGFEVSTEAINTKLFPFQRDAVQWALKLGKAALFEECGLGKTAQQLEWARHVVAHTGGKVIILAPLAVSGQTIREGKKFDVEVHYVKEQSEVGDHSIVITNYERLDKFDLAQFAGVVLDESSILKAFTGKTKQRIIEVCKSIPYKLACTATPAPNDYLELGNHADFLDIMPSNEMLSRWFINDTMKAGNYRLIKHAEKDYWRWLTSWAICLSKPADMGDAYDLPDFELKPLNIKEHIVDVSQDTIDRTFAEGRLIPESNPSATQLHKVKRESLDDRITKAVELVNELPEDEPVVIWCDTNYEADALVAAFPGAIEVRGDQSAEVKEKLLSAFSLGENRMMITKPDIAGFGLNWQHVSHMIFIGVSYSFEKTYQALRRSWRFGQERPVFAHFIYAPTEGDIMTTLKQKQEAFLEMQSQMNTAMHEHGLFRNEARLELVNAERDEASGTNWTLYLGDCVEVSKDLPENSVDFSIYSPPFANLYIYSDSLADMGNSADDAEFFDHYEFLIEQLYRVTVPGRLTAVHCKDLVTYMNRDGASGLKDFPGEIIRRHEKHGWKYHSRITIWKDPVIEMERTNAHGLLHANFAKRAEVVRAGLPDYLLLFRKWPVEGGKEIQHVMGLDEYIGSDKPEAWEHETRSRKPAWYKGTVEQYNYSIATWQRYASPVWWDVDQTNVLNFKVAKENQDEKHICPLQLDVIDRAIWMYTMPGETVLTPFAGIGSEVYSAIKAKRKGIGIELKRAYWEWAKRYCAELESEMAQPTLFDLLDATGD